MMIERVALLDRAQPFDIDRAMHDEPMHRPFEDICEQESQRQRQPFQPGDVVDVRNVDIKRRRADCGDDQDMDVTVIPADDARAVFLTKRFLSFGGNLDRVAPPLRRAEDRVRFIESLRKAGLPE
jgi:hypothetical protein